MGLTTGFGTCVFVLPYEAVVGFTPGIDGAVAGDGLVV